MKIQQPELYAPNITVGDENSIGESKSIVQCKWTLENTKRTDPAPAQPPMDLL